MSVGFIRLSIELSSTGLFSVTFLSSYCFAQQTDSLSLSPNKNIDSEDYCKQSKELEIGNKYAQNLIASQKQFLKYAIHETNTPLSIIMGNIEMFEIQFGKNKYLTNIEVAMKNIFSIYDDLSYLVKKNIKPLKNSVIEEQKALSII